MEKADFATEEILGRIEFVQAKRFDLLALDLKNVTSAHVLSIFCTLAMFGHRGVRVRLEALRAAEAALFGYRNSRNTLGRAIDYLLERGFIAKSLGRGRYGMTLQFTPLLTQILDSIPNWDSNVVQTPTELSQIGTLVSQIGISLDDLKKKEGERAQAREKIDFNNRSGKRKEDDCSLRPEFTMFTDTVTDKAPPLHGEALRELLNKSGLAGKVKKAGGLK
jgi:hypothetical protein